MAVQDAVRESLRYRVGAWLEARPWAREFVLREDPDSGEFVEHPVRVVLRVRSTNRINGHVVVRERAVNSWKGDGYIAAAMIGAALGAIAQYGLGSLIEALT